MNIKSKILVIALFILPGILFSQEIVISKKGQEIIRVYENTIIPAYLKPASGQSISTLSAIDYLLSRFSCQEGLSFKFISENNDNMNMKHIRYKQHYRNTPIEFAIYQVHEKNNLVESYSGVAFNEINIRNTIVMDEEKALQTVLNIIDATSYMWQFPEEEKNLKEFLGDESATYYPKGELVLINANMDFKSPKLNYAWKFDIYAKEPVSRAEYYIDAERGNILFINQIIHTGDVTGTAVTKFSGNKTITTDQLALDSFRLRESGRGKGIETYNLKNGTSYGNAVDFTDKDNYWNNVNSQKDEIATDAHWGTEMTYDYYKNKHSRNSIDNNGFRLRSYLHYSTNFANAFWNGQYMTYGDGSSTMQPFVALDIIGHEITHGLTSFTADLVYSSESGALNEGFSDIFGNMIELYAKPAQASWKMGDDVGYVIRDQQNPKSEGNPTTYGGQYWLDTKGCVPSQSNDQCGVHQNSTVNSYWFYLLINGGIGKNDINNNYNVTGIGVDKASAIAFRSLTVYLPASSDFQDARYFSARAAADLYGECSQEVENVLKAWYAVGIGDDGIKANFIATNTSSCSAPFSVEFKNQSDVYKTFLWKFGDGDTSTEANPVHTFNKTGKFTITLYASNTCKTDSITKTDYITVDTNLPCIFFMSGTGKKDSSNLCQGTLLDDGGTSNYSGNLESYFTISVPGSSNLTLEFVSFEFEECPEGCDFVYVYDGYDATAPLLGKFTGSKIPDLITTSGNVVTIRQSTDPYLTYSGFEMKWYCSNPNQPPKADFKYTVKNSCNGIAEFQSLGFNNPTSWYWDFGDGDTSSMKNPTHEYRKSGTYSVSHICINSKGSDTILKEDIIQINRPDAPVCNSDSSCGPKSFNLIATGGGQIKWYDENDSMIFSGDTFNTAVINRSEKFYVMSDYASPPKSIGPKDNTFGSGSMFTGNQSLIFDVMKPVELKSVKVYANGEKTRTIQLRDKNNITLQEATILIPNGESRINLNFKLTPGTGYRLGTTANPNMYRNSTNATYPYKIDNLISITGTTASQAGYYYFFYDWEIQEPACNSTKVPVNIWIDTLPDADFETTTQGRNVSFVNTSNSGRNILWNFGDGTFSKFENPVHTYPASGTYEATLSISNACGIDSIKKSIFISQSIKDDIFANNFRMYPNPVIQILNIEFSDTEPGIVVIRIFNTIGKEMISEKLNIKEVNKTSIDMSGMSEGLYFIQLVKENKAITKTIVIQK